MRWLKWLLLISRVRRDRRVRAALATVADLSWKQRAEFISGLARDPRLTRRAGLVPFLLVAYLASPVDLIPDFIPVLGQLDDLVVLSFLIRFATRALPPELLEEHLRRVRGELAS